MPADGPAWSPHVADLLRRKECAGACTANSLHNLVGKALVIPDRVDALGRNRPATCRVEYGSGDVYLRMAVWAAWPEQTVRHPVCPRRLRISQ